MTALSSPEPLVSVVTPTYNRAASLREAIESVQAQTYPHWELIIVDDGSTDGTRQLVEQCQARDPRIRYVHQANDGSAPARKHGIGLAQGEFIAFIDDDDLWLPDKLRRQVAFLQEHPAVAFLYTRCEVWKHGIKFEEWPGGAARPNTLYELFRSNFIPILTVMVRTSCLNAIGDLDGESRFSQDYDFWLKLAQRFPFDGLQEPLAIYRIHDTNLSKNLEGYYHDHFRVLGRVPVNPRVGITRAVKARRIAEDRIALGNLYRTQGRFRPATSQFARAVIADPLIGLGYWDLALEGRRFTAPYRFLKPYAVMGRCALHSLAKSLAARLAVAFLYFAHPFRARRHRRAHSLRIGLVSPEFYHEELNGFGGYGFTTKTLSDHFNSQRNHIEIDVLLTKQRPGPRPMQRYHQADVIFQLAPRAGALRHGVDFARYGAFLGGRGLQCLLTTEYYQYYEPYAMALPRTPIIVWIRDPRPVREWERIATVTLEKSLLPMATISQDAEAARASLQKILKLSTLTGRPVRFVHQAQSLVPLAQELYGLPISDSTFLPNPVSVPPTLAEKAERPTVCFLGRLDPIKRPWIFFEMARQMPDVEFLIAGRPHAPEVMEPIISRYRDLPNLRFLGLVGGEDKTRMLQRSWALVNTSIHEALPVSYLEAFAAGTPVVGSINPDGLVTRFGEPVPEVLGDALDPHAAEPFAGALRRLLDDPEARGAKGRAAKQYVTETHSFTRWSETIERVVRGVHA